jgi:hypothetical protein
MIPAKQSELRAWVENFSTLITANPTTYGLEAGDAVAIAAVVDPFIAAYDAQIDPGARTKALVAAKDAAKVAMMDEIRGYYTMIKFDQSVADADKVTLGVTLLRTAPPSPIPTPASMPLLTPIPIGSLAHALQFSDSGTPALKRRPYGAIGMLVFGTIGDAPTSDPGAAKFLRYVSRWGTQMLFDGADQGKTVTYFARWITATGLMGPWSNPVSLAVP